nr:HlyD family efflux transporter periplasmic adaptor subunit [Dyella sedimenti]
MFRPEVAQARHGEWLGAIIIASPPSRWIAIAFITATAMALLLFLFIGQYTRRETVTGQLLPSAGLLTLTASNAGTVIRIAAREGQVVKAGDVLLEVASRQDSAALGDTHELVGRQLDSQQIALQADLVTQAALTRQQGDALQAKLSLLRSQLAQIDDQLAIQQRQVTSNQALLERITPLASKGYVSALQIQQQETAVLDAQTQYKALARQRLDTQQQVEAAQQQLAQLPLDEEAKRNDTERQLASVRQSMAQNEAERAVVLRAPEDGVVSAILPKQGQAVASGQPVLSILPAGATLQAQLLAPSRAIGFIEPGNRVVLRYQAYPFQKFGQQYGTVSEISRSALSPTEAGGLIGQQVNEPMYRIHVRLDQQHVVAYGRPEPVKPGMALDADILMERRRLIEWVFEPLYGMGHRLLERDTHG